MIIIRRILLLLLIMSYICCGPTGIHVCGVSIATNATSGAKGIVDNKVLRGWGMAQVCHLRCLQSAQ